MFQRAWKNIIYLAIWSNNTHPVEFRTHYFTRLHNLKYLTINVQTPVFKRRVLYGLNRLEHLTLFNTHLLSQDELSYSPISSGLKSLQYLHRVRNEHISILRLELGESFWEFVGAVSLIWLDISGMNVTKFNLTSFNSNCQRLNDLTIRGTWFKSIRMTVSEKYLQSCRKLKVQTSSTTCFEKIKIMWMTVENMC